VLRGIDLDLYQGENLVVLGRSGTGKSVLIKLISGLLKPDAGEITVLGHNDVSQHNQKELQELRIRIGFSFQNSALYDSMTVRKNLEFPLVRNRKGITRAEINTALKRYWMPWACRKPSTRCLPSFRAGSVNVSVLPVR
jgi:phospholipid/cholesterol/gamma-HCH transport system ATP-binding protein